MDFLKLVLTKGTCCGDDVIYVDLNDANVDNTGDWGDRVPVPVWEKKLCRQKSKIWPEIVQVMGIVI